MNKKLIIPIIGFSILFISCSNKKIDEEKEEVLLDNITFESLDITYDGLEHEITCSNLPDSFYATYENNIATNPGTYYSKCYIYNKEDNTLEKELRAIITIDNQLNENFSEFSNTFFTDYLGNDYYSWNVFTIDSESLGFSKEDMGDPSWYSYSKISDEERNLILEDFNEIYTELRAFENESLSSTQQVSYDLIETICTYHIEYYSFENKDFSLIDLNYIDSFGGYVANFSDMLQNYHIRNEEDLNNIISYINSTKTSFPTYVEYVKDRIDANYALSDRTLSEMTDYLDTITEEDDNYYLFTLLNNEIDSLSFLDNTKKSSYKQAIETSLKNNFLPAVKSLSASLKLYMGSLSESNEGYLNKYGQKGKELYELILEDSLGIKLDMDEYEDYLDDKIEEYSKSLNEIASLINKSTVSVQSTAISYIYGYKTFGNFTEVDDSMIEFLKEFAKTIVPNLKSTPKIELNEMDETVGSITTTVAYYLKSPVDSSLTEYITLNPLYTSDNLNYALSTLAHEGYPGHLYSYVYAKESDLDNITIINGNTGQGEGWSNYVELKLYDYIIDKYADKKKGNNDPIYLACKYEYYNLLINYLLNARLDLGINYQGWNASKTRSYLSQNGFNTSSTEDIYNQLIEMPTVYAPYGYGMSFILDLHEKAKDELGEYYNEIDFNKNVILKDGEQGLSHLKKLTDTYIESIKFINNIN